MSLDPNAPVLGVDLGGTNTRVGLIAPDGSILQSDRTATSDLGRPGDLADWLAEHHRDWGGAACAVGIGAPNGHHGRGTVEHPPNLPWIGVSPLAELVTAATGLPTVLDNDANVTALGEGRYGAGVGLDDFTVVTLGTGIGGGVVVGGRVVRGADGFGGEIGHVIVEPGGRPCGCGRLGCAEKYASVSGLLISMREGIEAEAPGAEGFDGTAWLDDAQTAGARIGRAAAEGNPLALAAYDLAATMLARALCDVCAVVAPARVVLFGGLTQAGDLFVGPLRERFEAGLLSCHQGRIDVVLSGLPAGHAALLGAAALALAEVA